MAEGGQEADVDYTGWDNRKKVRHVQELFRGRYSEREMGRLLDHDDIQWDITKAVNFLLNENPQRVREITNAEEWITITLRRNQVIRDLALKDEIATLYRQFGCQSCDHVWWRKVPGRKQMSRCRRCKYSLDAIPKDLEWGWARFQCDDCGREFHGFGQMSYTESPCYHCGKLSKPTEVYPPFRREEKGSMEGRSRQPDRHSCTASNCWNRVHGGNPGRSVCVHPRSDRPHQVVSPSERHISTGSTVKTFLTQDELRSTYVPSEIGISEGSENEDEPADDSPRDGGDS